MRSRAGVSVTVQVSTSQCTVGGRSRWSGGRPLQGPAASLRMAGGRGPLSDVEEADVLGVAGDEAAAGVDVLAPEEGEQLVGGRGVLQGGLPEGPGLRGYPGLPQLGGGHLARAPAT